MWGTGPIAFGWTYLVTEIGTLVVVAGLMNVGLRVYLRMLARRVRSATPDGVADRRAAPTGGRG